MKVKTFISKCNSGKGLTAECHHSTPSDVFGDRPFLSASASHLNSSLQKPISTPHYFSWKHVIFTSTQLNAQKFYIKPLNKNSNQQIRHFHHQSLTFSISPFKSSNSPASAWTSNGSNSMGAKIEAKSRVFREFSKGVFGLVLAPCILWRKKKRSPLRFMLNVEYLEQQAPTSSTRYMIYVFGVFEN